MKITMIFTALALLFLVSCAGTGPLEPDPVENSQPMIQAAFSVPRSESEPWVWGVYKGTISADRTEVSLVPDRNSQFHQSYNVLTFLEQGPCFDCVKIISKEQVGPNRFDFSIQIEHPFPNHKELTGFDVFGGVQFASQHVVADDPYFWGDVFYMPWRLDGEPQLLNPDGYDRWLTTPQNNYLWGFQDGALGGQQVDFDEDGILHWGYRLFYTNENRHMFEAGGIDSRTYELWLPEGEEIKFGYVVVACWREPDVMPVTDPAVDFPINANRAGPYRYEVIDISGPLSADNPIFVTIRVYWTRYTDDDQEKLQGVAYRYYGFGVAEAFWDEVVEEGDGYSDIRFRLERWPDGPDKVPPGLYPHLFDFEHNYRPADQYDDDTGFFAVEIECID